MMYHCVRIRGMTQRNTIVILPIECQDEIHRQKVEEEIQTSPVRGSQHIHREAHKALILVILINLLVPIRQKFLIWLLLLVPLHLNLTYFIYIYCSP